MTLTIELNDAEEAQLRTMAREAGVPAEEWALKLVQAHLPQDPTLALFAQWKEEDAALTPEELAEAERECEEFQRNLNAERDRAGARRVYK